MNATLRIWFALIEWESFMRSFRKSKIRYNSKEAVESLECKNRNAKIINF